MPTIGRQRITLMMAFAGGVFAASLLHSGVAGAGGVGLASALASRYEAGAAAASVFNPKCDILVGPVLNSDIERRKSMISVEYNTIVTAQPQGENGLVLFLTGRGSNAARSAGVGAAVGPGAGDEERNGRAEGDEEAERSGGQEPLLLVRLQVRDSADDSVTWTSDVLRLDAILKDPPDGERKTGYSVSLTELGNLSLEAKVSIIKNATGKPVGWTSSEGKRAEESVEAKTLRYTLSPTPGSPGDTPQVRATSGDWDGKILDQIGAYQRNEHLPIGLKIVPPGER